MDRERLRNAYRQLDELDTMGSNLPDEGDPTDRGAILNRMVTGGEKLLRDADALGDSRLLAETHVTVAAALMDLARAATDPPARSKRLLNAISHCDAAVKLAVDMPSTAAGLDAVTMAMAVSAGGRDLADDQEQLLIQMRTDDYIDAFHGLYVAQHAIIGQATDDLMTGRLLFDAARQLDDADQRRLVWKEALQMVEGAEKGLRLSDEPLAADLAAKTATEIKAVAISQVSVSPSPHVDPVDVGASPGEKDDATVLSVPKEAMMISSPDDWQLRVIAGLNPGRIYALGEQARLGRHQDNSIQLNEERVSRQHAQIQRQDDAYIIIDLGSSNGTFVNGTAIDRPTTLNAGDRIRIGGTELEFSAQV